MKPENLPTIKQLDKQIKSKKLTTSQKVLYHNVCSLRLALLSVVVDLKTTFGVYDINDFFKKRCAETLEALKSSNEYYLYTYIASFYIFVIDNEEVIAHHFKKAYEKRKTPNGKEIAINSAINWCCKNATMLSPGNAETIIKLKI